MLAVMMAFAAPLPGQAPARLTEPRGFDFAPNGVWRARAARIRQQREAALARRDLASLNAPRSSGFNLMAPGQALVSSMAVTGIMRVPVFLVQYKNSAGGQATRQDYEDVLLSSTPPLGRPYTIRTYYEHISDSMFSVQGQVVGWIQLDSNDTWYEGPANGLNSAGRVAQLISEAVARSDTINFGQFDNDGPDGIPNSSDDDGYVDVAVFVHPEVDGACGPTSNRNIWSHRFFYQAWTGVALPTNDATNSATAGFSNTRVNSYTIQSGVGGGNACDPGSIMGIGTTAHETGHGLGLPDFYDTNFQDGDASEGIGHWGLMGSGNYASPLSPAHMEGFSRLQLGWVSLLDLVTSGTYALRPYTVSDTIYRFVPPAPNTRGEYFLVENRQLTGSDSGLADSALGRPKGPGLLVWHIDPQKYSNSLFSNSINTGPIHAVALMQADGQAHLRSSTPGIRNRGDAGDPFPGTSGNTVFGINSNPSSRLNDFSAAPFILDSIRQVTPQGEMAFRFRTGPLSLVSATDTTARVRVRGVAYGAYRDLFLNGDTVSVSMDSVQFSIDQRRKYLFLGWSDGGQRSHVATMTAGANLTASVARANRVQFSAQGAGTITATPTLVSGDYVAEGQNVTLTAVATAPGVFSGWSGDTTGTNPVLTLAMNRPFTVVATFFMPDNLIRQITRGGTYLTPAERSYLDQRGNHNGVYDLGDFVAWLDQTGTVLTAAQARNLSGGGRP